MNFEILKQTLHKKYVDLSELSSIFYKTRLFFKRKFGSFDLNYHYVAKHNKYSLILNQTFHSSSLDDSIWGISQRWGKVHPDSPHQYTDKMCVNIEDNKLRLSNKYAPSSGTQWVGKPTEFDWEADYAHGELESRKDYFRGVYEIRCKVPLGKDSITAFWLSGVDSREIDMFEFFPTDNNRNSKSQKITAHWDITKFGFKPPNHRMMTPKNYRLSYNVTKEFHTYTFVWAKDKLEFLFDGVVVRKIINKRLLKTFDNPMSIKLTNGIDYTRWKSNNKVELGDDFVIDYVKHWKEL